jgi:hypothetical protein
VRNGLAREGGGTLGGGSAEFASFLRAETGKWSKVVKASGARVD